MQFEVNHYLSWILLVSNLEGLPTGILNLQYHCVGEWYGRPPPSTPFMSFWLLPSFPFLPTVWQWSACLHCALCFLSKRMAASVSLHKCPILAFRTSLFHTWGWFIRFSIILTNELHVGPWFLCLRAPFDSVNAGCFEYVRFDPLYFPIATDYDLKVCDSMMMVSSILSTIMIFELHTCICYVLLKKVIDTIIICTLNIHLD